jgi:hypothetical protein
MSNSDRSPPGRLSKKVRSMTEYWAPVSIRASMLRPSTVTRTVGVGERRA